MTIRQPGRFAGEDEGTTAAEYAVMLALVLAALILAVTAVGNSTLELWTSNSDQIVSAIR